jgi:hypothetical protein
MQSSGFNPQEDGNHPGGDPTALQPKAMLAKAKEKERRWKSSRIMGLSSHQLPHCWNLPG